MNYPTPEQRPQPTNRELFVSAFTSGFRAQCNASFTTAKDALESSQTYLETPPSKDVVFSMELHERTTVLSGLIQLTRQHEDARLALATAEEVAGSIHDALFSSQGLTWESPTH